MLEKTVGGIATVLEGLEGSTELLELAEAEPDEDTALAVVADVNQMDVLTDRIGAIDGVERTSSAIVLSTKFER